MENLVIDRSAGLYRFQEGGKDYAFPSVTTVLGSEVADYSWSNDEALHRGTLVHSATAILDGDSSGLDWESVEPEYHGYIHGWEAFVYDCGFIPDLIETPVRHLLYQFAGTMDRLGTMDFKKKRCRVLPDIKTGDVAYPWEGLQTAAYLAAHGHKTGEKTTGILRMSVHLHKDGRYTPHYWDDPSDFPAFLNFLGGYNWKQRKLKRKR